MERLIDASRERKCSVFTAMKNPAVTAGLPAQARNSVEAFVHLAEHSRSQLHDRSRSADPRALQNWASHLLETVGYYQEIQRSEKNRENAESRIRNLKELLLTIDGAEERQRLALHERLESFLEEITLDTEREEEDEAPENAVTLITMHSCKGLEFPHVFIVGMEDGLLPHNRSKEEGTLDEERRLFYVAITRAMKTLNISHSATRKKYGQAYACFPSPFLADLPPELVQHADEAAKKPVAADSGKQRFADLRASLEL
jgi:superfamily I DNA/RNA helicase